VTISVKFSVGVLLCARIAVYNCVVRNTAQISSDNFSSYPPDNHHCSDAVYWSGGDDFAEPGVIIILD